MHQNTQSWKLFQTCRLSKPCSLWSPEDMWPNNLRGGISIGRWILTYTHKVIVIVLLIYKLCLSYCNYKLCYFVHVLGTWPTKESSIFDPICTSRLKLCRRHLRGRFGRKPQEPDQQLPARKLQNHPKTEQVIEGHPEVHLVPTRNRKLVREVVIWNL